MQQATQETTTPVASSGARTGGVWLPGLLITLFVGILFALRVCAPANLMEQDQGRPATYVLDVLKNGNWLCQHDVAGDIASKPPVWTWVVALISRLCGGVNLFSLYLPGALGALGTALLLFFSGRRHFGPEAGMYAVIASLVTLAGMKGLGLARTDGVFAFMVTAAGMLAFRAWTLGRGWTWFWVVSAIATLTKGPLGPVLAAGGLLAAVMERKAPERQPLRGSQVPGVLLFLALAGGWFLLAYNEYGPALLDKMIGKELVAHALDKGDSRIPGTLFYQPPLYYLGRAAPWSILAFLGFWRVYKYPAPEPEQRRFERFLFCWFFVGLALFSLAPHQRPDLLWPIMPAGALIAGKELARWAAGPRARLVRGGVTFVASGMLAWFVLYYYGSRAETEAGRRSAGLALLQERLEMAGGTEFPLTHVDTPMALQAVLNTFRPWVSKIRAERLLNSPEPAFVVVRNPGKWMRDRRGVDWYTVFPEPGRTNVPVAVISNRPVLRPLETFAFCSGPLRMTCRNVRLVSATEKRFHFVAINESAEVEFVNESSSAHSLTVLVENTGERIQRRQLNPSERWTWRSATHPAGPESR